jgi:hypothetical protein
MYAFLLWLEPYILEKTLHLYESSPIKSKQVKKWVEQDLTLVLRLFVGVQTEVTAELGQNFHCSADSYI